MGNYWTRVNQKSSEIFTKFENFTKMATAIEEEFVFESDFDEDFDYDNSQPPHTLRANFDLGDHYSFSDQSEADSDNLDPSDDDAPPPARAAAAAANRIDNSEESDGDTSDDVTDHTHTPEHLQFVFEELDLESLPVFDWKSEQKVFVSPAFDPAKPYGPTRAMPANSQPVDYFNIFYDDAMMQKVCILLKIYLNLINFYLIIF